MQRFEGVLAAAKQLGRQVSRGVRGWRANYAISRRIRESVAQGHQPPPEDLILVETTRLDTRRLARLGVFAVVLPEAIPFLVALKPDFLPSTSEDEQDRECRHARSSVAMTSAALCATMRLLVESRFSSAQDAAAIESAVDRVHKSTGSQHALEDIASAAQLLHSARNSAPVKDLLRTVALQTGAGALLKWRGRSQIERTMHQWTETDKKLRSEGERLRTAPHAAVEDLALRRLVPTRTSRGAAHRVSQEDLVAALEAHWELTAAFPQHAPEIAAARFLSLANQGKLFLSERCG